MVLGEQALEHLLTCGMADCVANAVILGEGLDLVEVVLQVEVLPAVGITHGEVELDVEPAQFEQRLEAGGGSVGVLLRHLRDRRG